MKRRSFLALGSAAFAVPAFADEVKKRRAAVIGHTGRGDYGHGLDTVWLKIPGVDLVAVADAGRGGLAKALRRLGVDRGFSDYRRMLEEMKPEFVSVCPRHVDQHAEMILACVEAGVKGIYVEKPFCRTPEEGDRILAACKEKGARVAVAHRNPYNPVLSIIDQLIEDRKIGKLLEIRGRGKGDRRGGVEDLWVLGSHVLNMIHHFGGEPVSCSAVMLQDGERVTKEDIVYPGPEGLGPLAGNELHARYLMQKGVMATFDSIANDGTSNAGFGLQLVGSEGIINIQADRDPLAHLVPGNPFKPTEEPRPWIPITTAGVGKPEDQPDLIKDVHEHVVAIRDLIAACDEERAPLCDAKAGMVTVEMVCAVFESHRQGSRAVAIPLEERGHPLLEWNKNLKSEVPLEAAGEGGIRAAVAIPGKPGFYFNPFTNNPVDARGVPPGTLLRDPQDPDPAHKFRIP